MNPLNILITNLTLAGYTGTELVVRDLVLGFKKLGHHPMLYSPLLGGISQEIMAAGVEVVTNLEALSKQPDIIHGHHHVESMEALLQFPTAPALFVCHDLYAWHDIPPRLNTLMAYVAVSWNTRQRLIQDYDIPENKTRLIYNWVDIERFKARPVLPDFPKRAVVFSNYMRNDSKLEIIREACSAFQISLDVVGFGFGKGSKNPEDLLGQYDLVFAIGKCALEAMATGCAVILCGSHGLGEMVTMDRLAYLRERNFGATVTEKPATLANLMAEIQAFNAKDAAKVSQFIREKASLEGGLATYLSLYAELIEKKSSVGSTLCLRDYIKHQVLKIGDLESRLHAPFDMQPWNDEALSKLTLEWIESKKTAMEVAANVPFSVKVQLKNNSSYKLGSYKPSPLYFSYHWFLSDQCDPFIFEGIRTVIDPWLAPSESAHYDVIVLAPEEAGSYDLVISLVQEGVRWSDQLENPVLLRTHVGVV